MRQMNQSVLNKIDFEKSRRAQARLSAMIESLGNIDEVADDTEDSIKEEHEYQIIDSSSSASVSSSQFEPLRPMQLDFNSNIHTPPDQQISQSFSSQSTGKEKPSGNNNNNITSTKATAATAAATTTINNKDNDKENIIDNAIDFAPQHLPPQPQFHTFTSVNSTPSISTSIRDPSTKENNINRFSMLSDYSGVIHEGTEVSYVVTNKNISNSNENTNNIPTSTINAADMSTTNDNNDTNDSKYLSMSSQPITKNELIIKQIKNARQVNKFNSLRSDSPNKPQKSHLKYHSDPLLLGQEETREQMNNLSIEESVPSIVENQNKTDLDDSFSIQSSIIHTSSVANETKNDKSNESMEPLLNEEERSINTAYKVNINNNYNGTGVVPRVPPRNKNRPKTIIIDEDLSNPEILKTTNSVTGNNKNNDDNFSNNNNNRNSVNRQQFNAHTISQLLSITNGTLIGSEFQDLPIPIEEKRALERLVDSLSRLTADMVLDPERYEQGLIRLKKAIRALEGFQ